MEMSSGSQEGIFVRITPECDIDVDPCGVVPLAGLQDFWNSLAGYDGEEKRRWGWWMRSNRNPILPEFPIVSMLAQMEIDIAEVQAGEIPSLIHELKIGRGRCANLAGLAAFDALGACAMSALSQSKGIVLSPFG